MNDQRTTLVERLDGGPAAIAEAARAVEAAEARARPDAWSARQNVAHLVLVERQVFQPRLRQLAAEGVPAWAWTEPASSDDPDVATLEAALATFAAVRTATVEHVRSLDDAGWRRFGQHATYGRLDVAGLLEVIVDHDDHHRADIEALGRGSKAVRAARP